jgi:amino acid transporter
MTAAKAIAAAIGVFVTALAAALADEVLDLSEVGQLVAVLITAVGTVVAVYKVPNQPADTAPAEKVRYPSDGGYATSELLLLIIAVCVVLALLFGWDILRIAIAD